MKASTIIISVVVVAGGAFGAMRWRVHSGSTVVHYETTVVDRGRLSSKVTATGTLSALVTVQVGSQVSGRVQQLLVDYNSPVKKGQVLARIDPQLFDAALAQAKANVQAAQGGITKAKAQAADALRIANRAKTLSEQHILSQSEVDTAQTNLDAADAQVVVAEAALAQAQASYQLAEVNLAYTTISSPIDGIVISRSVDVGQTVAASLQAPTLFSLAEDMGKMQVDTNVAEADVGKLRPEMPATFTVDAYPTERFRGSVRQIRNAPQVVQSVVTYDAVIDVANPELKLKPGMTANVTFTWADKEDALKVPNAALRFRPPAPPVDPAAKPPTAGANPSTPSAAAPATEVKTAAVPAAGAPAPAAPEAAAGGEHKRWSGQGGGGGGKREGASDKRTVYVLRDGAPAKIEVRIGITDGSSTEIVEGELKEGDPVITDMTGGELPKAPANPQANNALRRAF